MSDIKQLVTKDTEKKNIFPKVDLEGIFDSTSAQSLKDILLTHNMYLVPWQGDTENTRLEIPSIIRRRGLFISYFDSENHFHSEYFIGNELSDNTWKKDENWVDATNKLSGDITIGANGHWYINNEDSGIDAKGDTGTTPLLRIEDNKLQVSYDEGQNFYNVTDNPVYTQFRWVEGNYNDAGTGKNVGKIEVSTDLGKTWQTFSQEFANNLHIKDYVATQDKLPADAPEGTIYMVGSQAPYTMFVKTNSGWKNNGEFTSVNAGIVQELGDAENAVISQKVQTIEFKKQKILIENRATKDLGKNILNPKTYIEGIFMQSTGALTTTTYSGLGVTPFMPINNGDVLTSSGANSLRQCAAALYDENFKVVPDSVVLYDNTDNKITISYKEGAKYVVFSFREVPSDSNKEMIEYGSEKTNYVPYTEHFSTDVIRADLNEADKKLSQLYPLSINTVEVTSKDFAIGFMNKEGTVNTNASFCTTDFIPIQFPVFELLIQAEFNNPYGGGIIFFDKNKKLLKWDKGDASLPFISSYGNRIYNYDIKNIPEDTAFIRICANVALENAYVKLVYKMSSETHEEVYNTTTTITFNKDYGFVEGFTSKNGIDNSNSSFLHTNLIKLNKPITKLYAIVTSVNEYGGGLFFFDKNKKLIKWDNGESFYQKPAGYGNAIFDYDVSLIPEDAEYIKACGHNMDNVYLEIIQDANATILSDLQDIKEKISEIGEDGIEGIINRTLNNKTGKTIMPNTIYLEANNSIPYYYKQAVCQATPNINCQFDWSVSNLKTIIDNGRFVLLEAPNANGSYMIESVKDSLLNIIYLQRFNIKVTNKPSTQTNITILPVGSSTNDIGVWQAHLKDELLARNINVKFIGTMGQSSTFNNTSRTDIAGESLSGGTMDFMTTSMGAVQVLTVSGITELPKDGYPGTAYKDTNGTTWVCRGYKLEKQSNGTYSGKLKLGIFKSDPNYGDGTSDGKGSVATFPSSGVITKTVSSNGSTLAGDSIINYTSVDTIDFNPFWNRTTNLMDFNYYFQYWGFNVPDILVVGWGYNDTGKTTEDAVAMAKSIIDRWHEQYPTKKIIFKIDTYGAEVPTYANNLLSYNKKIKILQFAQGLIDTCDNSTYNSFLYILPAYAFADHVYGFGKIVERKFGKYEEVSKVLQNGKDGVHATDAPSASTEAADAMIPMILDILND